MCSIFGGVVVALSLSAAYLLPKSYPLTVFGDGIQIILITAATILAFQSFQRGHSHVRGFWLFVTLGCFMWLASLCLWSTYEVVLRREVPDIPAADVLLFLKLVPLTAALALEPHKGHDSRLRAFGLLDVSILILYSLYLYAFSVFAYRLGARRDRSLQSPFHDCRCRRQSNFCPGGCCCLVSGSGTVARPVPRVFSGGGAVLHRFGRGQRGH